MRKFLVAGAIGTWLLGSACGRLGTGDNMIEEGDGDASIGSGKGDGDTGDGDIGDGDFGPGDGDLGDGDIGDGDVAPGDGDLGDGDLGGMPGDGDGDAAGGLGGGFIGDGDGDIVLPNPSVPVCTITTPEDNATTAFHGERVGFASAEPSTEVFSGVTFRAVATDLEDGKLESESIAWFLEGSNLSEEERLLGRGSEIVVEALPPGENKIACRVVDSDQNVGFDYVHVLSVSPVVYIHQPGEIDGPRPSSEAVEFWAQGYDYEDGQLDSETFVWDSSIDGQVGVGNGSYHLGPGQHEITVKAWDADENLATESVFVWITELQIEPVVEPTD